MQRIVSRVNNRAWVGKPKCGWLASSSCLNRGILADANTLDIGRDTGYLDTIIKFSVHVMVVSRLINLFPDFLKPYAFAISFQYGPLSDRSSIIGGALSKYNPPLQAAEDHIKPIILQREQQIQENGGDWGELPVSASLKSRRCSDLTPTRCQDDMLTWLMQNETGPVMDYGGIIGRLMNVNLASVHTTSMVRTCAEWKSRKTDDNATC